MIPIGTTVKIVDDVDKPNSTLIGKTGIVIDYKWNKYRREKNLPVVRLADNSVVNGWSLWFITQ